MSFFGWLIRLSVCLFVREHIRDRWTDLHEIFMRIPCGRDSLLLLWHCDMLCTSGFVDDVIFGHNGPYTAYSDAILGPILMSECLVGIGLCPWPLQPWELVWHPSVIWQQSVNQSINQSNKQTNTLTQCVITNTLISFAELTAKDVCQLVSTVGYTRRWRPNSSVPSQYRSVTDRQTDGRICRSIAKLRFGAL